MDRMSSHYLNGGSGRRHARQPSLQPSDFIGAPATSLSSRLRAAGIPEDALERSAEETVSDMARRFAPDFVPDDDTKNENAREFPAQLVLPEEIIPSPLAAMPRPELKPAPTSPWMLLALVLACAAPSAFAGYALWNGDLPNPLISLGVQPSQTAVREPVEDPAAAPPPAVVKNEGAAQKNQERLKQLAGAAIPDSMTRSSDQPKTAMVDPAPVPEQARALEVSVAPALDAQASNANRLAISVQPSSAIPQGARIAIMGLPEGAVLSAGEYRLDGWSLHPDELDDLKVAVPDGGGGDALIEVTVKSVAGLTLAEAQTVITLQSEPVLQQDNGPQVAGMMENGRKMMDVGYISGARAYYIRAAEAGSPEGAMEAAKTFDPKVLGTILAFGVLPDVAQARRWYERAKALGAPDADAKLAALSAG